MATFSDLRDLYDILGPARFVAFLALTVGAIVGLGTASWWFAGKVGWPEAYGFDCRGRGCLLVEMRHSFKLLEGGSWDELALFACIWAIPAAVILPVAAAVGNSIWRRHNDPRYRKKVRIIPLDPD